MKYTVTERSILMRALDNEGYVTPLDEQYDSALEHLVQLGVILTHGLPGMLEENLCLSKPGKRAARALVNLYKAYIGKPGHCAFCGVPETSHGHYPDGSEDWECPRCGYCEDYHLDQQPPAQPIAVPQPPVPPVDLSWLVD